MELGSKVLPACVGLVIGSVVTFLVVKPGALPFPTSIVQEKEPTREEIMKAARPVMMMAAADTGACAPIAGGGFVCQVIFNLDNNGRKFQQPIMFRKGSQGWVGSLQ